MRNISKRFLSLTMALLLVMNVFPVSALMEGENSGLNSGAQQVVLRTTSISSDLKQFLTDADISAPKNGEGAYVVMPGDQYSVKLSFKETPGLQFPNDGAAMTYTLPDGLNANTVADGKFSIKLNDGGTYYTITDNTYSIDGNTLTIRFNTEHADFSKLAASSNLNFSVSFDGSFSENATQISFSDEVTKDIQVDTSNSVEASKSASFDKQNNKVNYTVSVKSTGKSTNVVIEDTISDSHGVLSLDTNSIIATSSTGQAVSKTGTAEGNHFQYTIPEMANGEVITFQYSASIDPSKIPVNNGQYVEIGNNKVKVNSTGDPTPDEVNINTTIDYTPVVRKGNAVVAEDGKTLSWTITANEDARVSMAGSTITDTIRDSARSLMKYSGTGITIKRFDSNGQQVGNEETVSWETLNVSTNSAYSWAYTIPSSETTPYKYEITYTTEVDTTGQTSQISVNNDVTTDGGSQGSGSGTVTPSGGEAKVYKSVNKVDLTNKSITWDITISVPEAGLSKAVVKDNYPAKWLNGVEMIETVPDPTNPGISVQVQGLQESESYTVSHTDRYLEIIFYKESNNTQGLNGAAGGRTVTVQVTTKIDENWLNESKTNSYYLSHDNNVEFTANSSVLTAPATAYATLGSIKKTAESSGMRTENGIEYPVYKFTVLLSNVTSDINEITDVFDTNLLRLATEEEIRSAGGDSWFVLRMTNAYNNVRLDTPVSYIYTANGIKFITSAESMPHDQSSPTGFYAQYKLTYYLTVKDAAALKTLTGRAVANDDGKYTLNNTAEWENSTDTGSVTYQYKGLTKEILTPDSELQKTDEDIWAEFRITLNPAGANLNGGEPLTVTDSFRNLSVDYTSIIADPSNGVKWDFSGNTATFTIPDSTKVVITYRARVVLTNIGSTGSSQQIGIYNKAEMSGYSGEINKTAQFTHSAEGAASNPAINLMKYQAGDMTNKLSGAVFILLDQDKKPVRDKDGNQVTFTTDSNGMIHVQGNQETLGWTLEENTLYYLRETQAPEGYMLLDYDSSFMISADGTTDYDHYIYHSGDTMSAKNYPGTDVHVEKVWADGNGKHSSDSITVKLQQKIGDGDFSDTIRENVKENGKYVWKDTATKTIVLNQSNDWQGAFNQLPLYVPADLSAAESEDVAVEYQIVETLVNGSAPAEGTVKYILVRTGNQGAYQYTVTNTPAKGNLKITKTVSGVTLGENKTYYFQVSRKDGNTTKYYTVNGEEKDDSSTTIEVAVLKDSATGETTVENLNPGTYTVAEMDNERHQIANYQLTVENAKTAAVISGVTASVSFTNTYIRYADLNLEGMKFLDNAASGVEFSFEIKDITDYPAGTPEKNKAILPAVKTVKNTTSGTDKGKFIFTDIQFPTDGTYKLLMKETALSADSIYIYDTTEYELTVTVTKGTAALTVNSVTAGSAAYSRIENTNTYRIYKNGGATFSNTTKKGKLTIKKDVKGDIPDNLNNTFQFTLRGKDGKHYSSTNNPSDSIIYIAVSSQSSEGVTISGLPLQEYTLTETNSAVDNYTLSTTYVGLTDNQNHTVTFSPTNLEATATVTNTYTRANAVPMVIKGVKVLDGSSSIPAGTFRFKVTDTTAYAGNAVHATVPVDSVSNDASGNFTLTGISFSAVGTYTLNVQEVAGTDARYIYDSTQYTVTVTVVQDGNDLIIQDCTVNNGTVGLDTSDNAWKITKSNTDSYTFANTTKKGQLTIKKSVMPEGVGVKQDADFTFTLTDQNGNTYDQNGNPGTGKTITVKSGNTSGVTIQNLPLGKYTLTEDSASAKESGYTLKTEYQVGTDKTNEITFNASESANAVIGKEINVTNTYTKYKNAVIHLSGTKSLEGKPLEAGQFTFRLTQISPAPETVIQENATNDANGNIRFDEISYSSTGTYQYTIQETTATGNGIYADKRIYTVTVEVSVDDANEKMTAAITGVDVKASSEATTINPVEDKKIVFVNRYLPTAAELDLEAQKTLNGATLQNRQFKFELIPSPQNPDGGSTVAQEKWNDAEGKITFDKLRFTKTGDFVFTVKETSTTGNGITVDSSEYIVQVNVSDNGTGQLIAAKTILKKGEETDTIEFENTYTPNSTIATIQAKKTLSGRELKDGEFTFTLTPDGETNPIQTVTNKGENVNFNEITYSAPAVYWYTIKELGTDTSSMDYDQNVYWAKVTVTDSQGNLSATVMYYGSKEDNATLTNNEAVFNNTYHSGSLKIQKQVTGNKVTDTEKNKFFTFNISLMEGTKPVTGAFNVSIGSESKSITFNDSGIGTIQLKHNQTAEITGLPKGVSYTVSETPAEGYVTTWSGSGVTGTIGEGNTIPEIICINQHDTKGNMTIKKEVSGNAGDHNQSYSFKLTVWDKDGEGKVALANKTYGSVTLDSDGSSAITITEGTPVTLTDLPNGAYFELVEEDAGEGYIPSATVESNGKAVGSASVAVEDLTTGGHKKITVTGTISDSYKDNKILVITVTNTRNLYGGFSLKKTVSNNTTDRKFSFNIELNDDTITGPYGDISFNRGKTTVELGNNEEKCALGLPHGIRYTITESDYSDDGYTASHPVIQGTVVGTQSSMEAVTGKDKIDSSNQHTANNAYTARGVLSITKRVDGNNSSQISSKRFNFTLKLLNNTDQVDGGSSSVAADLPNNQTATWSNGELAFTLAGNETATVSGLLHGTQYQVTETIESNDEYYGKVVQSSIVNGENGNTGVINARGDNKVTVTNTLNLYGGLKIQKVTAGTDPDKKTWFAMKITLSDASINGQYGDVYFINGVSAAPRGTSDKDYSNGKVPDGYFKVSKDQPLYVTGLPANISYTVVEDSYEGTYDSQVPENATGTISDLSTTPGGANQTAIDGKVNDQNYNNIVTYTNTRNRTGKLVIRKEVSNSQSDTNIPFTFNITMTQKDGSTPLTGTYDGVTFDSNGRATVYLKANEEQVISGLPLGAIFNVVESRPNGYLAPAYSLSYREAVKDSNGESVKDADGNTVKVLKTFTGTVSDDGSTVTWQTDAQAMIQVDQRIVTITNTISRIEIAKVDNDDPTQIIAGAKLQIKEGDSVVKEWTSSGSGDEITGLKLDTEYTLSETEAPKGYNPIGNHEIKFKITEENGTLAIQFTENSNMTGTGDDSKTIAELAQGNSLRMMVKNEKIYTPELEKYVNKNVHADLGAFDEVFNYDLVAFVTGNADTVEITDTLKETLQFAPKNGNVRVYDLGKKKVDSSADGIEYDHQVQGSVQSIIGTDITGATGVRVTTTGRKLTVTLSGDRVTGATTGTGSSAVTTEGLRGHYVKVTFNAVLSNDVVGDILQYDMKKTGIQTNGPVLGGIKHHEGIDNTCEYRIKVGNKWAYKLTSNTVTVTPPTINVKIEKKWTDKDDASITWPEGAAVKVILQSTKAGKATDVPGVEPIELNSGKTEGAFENLPVYQDVTYTVREEVTGIDQRAFDFALSAPDDSVLGVRTYTITNKIYLTSVSVKKVWIDENNSDGVRPTSILVTLLADGVKETSVSLNAANGWQATVENLPKTQKSDRTKEIKYTWEEETVPGYTLAETVTSGNITMLVNTHTPELIEIPVRKVWDDSNNAANKRPASVTVQLFADGMASGPAVTLSAANEWRHTWTELQKNAGGKAIAYTVEEIGVPDGYEARVSGSASTGFTVTNTLPAGDLVIRKTFLIEELEIEPEEEPEWREITVNKIWNDNNNADGNRPASVTVRLYAGVAEVASAELTEANGWSHTFMGLLKEENGVRIRYTVYEDPVAWYTSTVRGFTITNTYQPQTTSTAVTKVWHDDDNKGGFRPKQVVVTLRRNGSAIRHLVLSEKNHWTAIATGLPTMVNGETASYTWTEEPVVGYEVESSVTRGDTTTITNKLWERPPVDEAKKPKKAPGDTFYIFEEYETPLGVEVMINHVGDCFD